MKKKKMILIVLVVIIILFALYILLGSMSIKSKTYKYLTDKGYEPTSTVKSVKVKYSLVSLLIFDDAWGIEVRYYDEPDVIYGYKYKNSEIVSGGISGGVKEKWELKHTDKWFSGKIVEIYSNESFIVEPNENEDIRNSSNKININFKSDIVWKVGMEVMVTYTGGVMESYPAQIRTIDVKIDDMQVK